MSQAKTEADAFAVDLAARVNAVVTQARESAAPFVPTHAEIASRLAPLVDEILALPLPAVADVFRGRVRPGTWDVHVLAEVKSGLELARRDLGKG